MIAHGFGYGCAKKRATDFIQGFVLPTYAMGSDNGSAGERMKNKRELQRCAYRKETCSLGDGLGRPLHVAV